MAARLVLALLLLTHALAGCADEGPATWRFKGQLDRDLSEAEQEEMRDAAGKDYTVESTLVACAPGVDPYDCNQVWLRVDEITEARCGLLEERLASRTYWRGAPTCDQPPGS